MGAAEPRLDAVLFDVDDTLYSTTAFASKARRNAVRAMIAAGLRAEEDDTVSELAEVVVEYSSNYEHHFDRLLDRIGRHRIGLVNPAVVVAAGVVAYHRTKESDLKVLPDARALLDALQGSGVRLGVVSAGLQIKQAEKLVRLDLLGTFDPSTIFFCDQMGVSKPNPKLFQKVCRTMALRPDRCLYVGDRPDHDIGPASEAGLVTVLYRGAGGRYADAPSPHPPDHDLRDLRDLVRILAERYALPLRA